MTLIEFFIENTQILKLMIIALALLLFSISDLKKRSIKFFSAMLFLIIGIAFFFAHYDNNSEFYESNNTILLFLFIPALIVFTFLGIIGMGDLFVLAGVMLLTPYNYIHNDTIVSTLLTNSLLFYLLVFPLNVIRNIIDNRKGDLFYGLEETRANKIKALIFGHKAKQGNKGFILQKGNKLDFKFKNVNKTQFNETLNVWIIPAYPFIPFILMGFIAQLILGDMLGLGDYLNWKFR